jgi:hypothetical protein
LSHHKIPVLVLKATIKFLERTKSINPQPHYDFLIGLIIFKAFDKLKGREYFRAFLEDSKTHPELEFLRDKASKYMVEF